MRPPISIPALVAALSVMAAASASAAPEKAANWLRSPADPTRQHVHVYQLQPELVGKPFVIHVDLTDDPDGHRPSFRPVAREVVCLGDYLVFDFVSPLGTFLLAEPGAVEPMQR